MNCYQVLGIEKTATDQEIKKTYHKLAIKWHPDKNLNNTEKAGKKFKEIQNAYDKISTPEKRQQYDNPPRNNHIVFNFNNIHMNLFNQMQNMHSQINIQRINHMRGRGSAKKIIKTIQIINGVRIEKIIIID